MFSIPKDPEKRKLWAEALKRPDIKSGQVVCENHFLPEELIRQRLIVGPDGSQLGVVSKLFSQVFFIFYNYKIRL